MTHCATDRKRRIECVYACPRQSLRKLAAPAWCGNDPFLPGAVKAAVNDSKASEYVVPTARPFYLPRVLPVVGPVSAAVRLSVSTCIDVPDARSVPAGWSGLPAARHGLPGTSLPTARSGLRAARSGLHTAGSRVCAAGGRVCTAAHGIPTASDWLPAAARAACVPARGLPSASRVPTSPSAMRCLRTAMHLPNDTCADGRDAGRDASGTTA